MLRPAWTHHRRRTLPQFSSGRARWPMEFVVRQNLPVIKRAHGVWRADPRFRRCCVLWIAQQSCATERCARGRGIPTFSRGFSPFMSDHFAGHLCRNWPLLRWRFVRLSILEGKNTWSRKRHSAENYHNVRSDVMMAGAFGREYLCCRTVRREVTG